MQMPKLINIAAAVEVATAAAAAQSLDSTSLSRFYWRIERKQVGECGVDFKWQTALSMKKG